MRLKSWKVLPLLLAILSVLCVVSSAQGTLYKGDWCSFEVPDGCTVTSESPFAVLLEKPVSPDTGVGMHLDIMRCKDVAAMNRDEYISSLEERLQTIAIAEEISQRQRGGILGDCIYAKTGLADGLHGKTAFDIRYYDYPNMKILSYFWVEGNDAVRMRLRWIGPRSLDLDPDDTIKPLNDAYRTFKYYG